MFILAITGAAFIATVFASALLLAAPREELAPTRPGRRAWRPSP
ncbi:hypothetical protein [Flavimaribacter sediminis]|nr:hypothetical protein [Flavimaribacter sediminis]